jgi:hypothetical protein
MRTGTNHRGLIVGIVALAAAASCHVPAATAQETGVKPEASVKPQEAGAKAIYYVDFRARTAATYGHAFVWFGRMDRKQVEVAGLHPASESPIPYIIGQIFPVPSETGKSYGDLDEAYLTGSYRVVMTEAQAKPVFAYIKRLQESSPLWNATVYNCVSFIQDIARFMGLKVPNEHVIMPDEWVNKLRRLNGGRENQVVALSNILAGSVPKTAERKPAEPKTAEPKTAEPKTAEPKTAEPKTAAPRTAGPRTAAPAPKTSETAPPTDRMANVY